MDTNETSTEHRARPLRLVMAGGGTGGHLFPAISLAEELLGRNPGMEIIFVGGVGGLEEKIVPELGYKLELLNVEGLKRRTGVEKIRAVVKAAWGTFRAAMILRRIRPDGVIGSGSYSSGPVVLAARILGMKTAILEQNAMPGLTNRLLGRIVDRVYIAFEPAQAYFPAGRTLLTGTPVRREILTRLRERTGRRERFTLLVFGGSQGATAINAAFVDATEYLTDIWSKLRVVHQSGKEGYDLVEDSYRRKGLKVELHRFIDDMASAYSSADLVVCRAGAATLAEITALGLPSILVPYPFASDFHQEKNAQCLQQSDAAVVLMQEKLTGHTLAKAIRRFIEDPQMLKKTRDAVRRLGRPTAASTIAEDYMKLLKRAA